MAQMPPSDTALRVSQLSQSEETRFALRPDRPVLEQIARDLGLSGLRKVTFEGHITAQARADWQLSGKLGATVTQPCVITLEPVTTRLEVDTNRLFLKDYQAPEEQELEMPDDETVEPLGTWIDPFAVMIEALTLALPEYPRKEDASLGQMIYAEPGTAAMTDEDARPFAGLALLKSKLDKGDQD